MERKAKSFFMMFLVIGLLSGQSTAWFKDFKNCIKDCVVTCLIPPWTPVCPASCLAKCIIHSATAPTSAHYCTLGCATSLCSKLITKDDLHLDEVESCVDTCSGSCNKNYVSLPKHTEEIKA